MSLAVWFLLVISGALQTAQTQKLDSFVLKNRNGIEAHILPYGAIVQKLLVPSRSGTPTDVVLGFDDLTPYQVECCAAFTVWQQNSPFYGSAALGLLLYLGTDDVQVSLHFQQDGTSPYFGALVGRVANRIAEATFELDGEVYHVSANENTTSLHGGKVGFSKRFWKGHVFSEGEDSGVMLRYESPDGKEGYPGSLTATVIYLLTASNELRISMEASTLAATPVNLAQHTYFNLNGQETASTVLNHDVSINAAYITPVTHQLIPTGAFMPVVDTPYDLNNSTRLSRNVNQAGGLPEGYDINYVLFGLTGEEAKEKMLYGKVWDEPQHAVTISSPTTGITLEVDTTSPGLQFYSGGLLSVDTPVTGKAGVDYPQFGGFAVETQNFPNAINTPSFPDSVLRPGHTYQNVCIWRFKTLPRQGRTQRLFVGLGVVLILVAAIAFYTQYYNVNSRYRLRAPRYDKT